MNIQSLCQKSRSVIESLWFQYTDVTLACENREVSKVTGFKKFRLFKAHKLLVTIYQPFLMTSFYSKKLVHVSRKKKFLYLVNGLAFWNMYHCKWFMKLISALRRVAVLQRRHRRQPLVRDEPHYVITLLRYDVIAIIIEPNSGTN